MALLSAGGEDALTLREFDLRTGSFVPGGFAVPHGKLDLRLDRQGHGPRRPRLGPRHHDESGYPFTLRIWKRGQPLDERQRSLSRRTPPTYGAGLHQGHSTTPRDNPQSSCCAAPTIFRIANSRSSTPAKAQKNRPSCPPEIHGLLDGQIIVELESGLEARRPLHHLPQGAVIALDLEVVKKDPLHLKPTVVFTPTAQEFAQEGARHQKPPDPHHARPCPGPRLRLHPQPKNIWTAKKLDSPITSAVSIDDHQHRRRSLLPLASPASSPPPRSGSATQRQGPSSSPRPCPRSSTPPTSSSSNSRPPPTDGTKVPYFIVHRKDMQLRRLQPHPHDGLRRLPGLRDARATPASSASSGSSAAASSSSPTSAAAASSAPPGTRPA